jgi:CheY-like chemotaxis protein
MNASTNGSIDILVVEDNPGDVVFFTEAVETTQTQAAVHVVSDGSEAMKFLRRQPPFADAVRPTVMVLDLNLPIKTGREVLHEMMADPQLRTIPVAVLTTSTSERWVCDVCTPGRCLYFTKTADFSELQDIVRQIAQHAKTSS